jgi:hypothetical protein
MGVHYHRHRASLRGDSRLVLLRPRKINWGARVEQLVRAISIRQPYVERILNGTKKAEFRSRRTLIRERVYLYVSMRRVDPADRSWRSLGKTPA